MSINKKQLANISKKKKNRDITFSDIPQLLELYLFRGMTNEDAIAELERDMNMTVRYQIKFFKVNSFFFGSNGWFEIDAYYELFEPDEPEILVPSM